MFRRESVDFEIRVIPACRLSDEDSTFCVTSLASEKAYSFYAYTEWIIHCAISYTVYEIFEWNTLHKRCLPLYAAISPGVISRFSAEFQFVVLTWPIVSVANYQGLINWETPLLRYRDACWSRVRNSNYPRLKIAEMIGKIREKLSKTQ